MATGPPPQVVAMAVDVVSMVTRALIAALLLAIPFIASVAVVRRAGHPDVR
jgi:hypothetical protein